MMFSLRILVVLFLSLWSVEALWLLQREDAESFHGLSDVVANLVTLDNTDPVIISDFDLKQQVSIVYVYYKIKQ